VISCREGKAAPDDFRTDFRPHTHLTQAASTHERLAREAAEAFASSLHSPPTPNPPPPQVECPFCNQKHLRVQPVEPSDEVRFDVESSVARS
jgi:hypothetical protein